MASDNRSIVITLKLDQGTNGEKTEEAVDTSGAVEKNDKDSTAKALATYAVTETIGVVGSEVVNWAMYQWDRQLNLADDYIGQRNKSFALEQIGRATNVAASVRDFAIRGAIVGGPTGAVVGAALGVAVSGAGIIRSNIQGMDQQNIRLRQIDAQLGYTRQRAGWSLEAASIGEDL